MSQFSIRCLCCFFILFLCVQNTMAGEFSLGAGINMSTAPYKSYDTQWTPFPVISYEGDVAYIRGYNAGIKLCNLQWLEISAFAGYDPTSFSAAETSNHQLKQLRDRDSSAVAGAEARLITPYGMLHASCNHDLLGRSRGAQGVLGYMHSLEYGPVELIPAVGLYWSDARYNDYYYGVSAKESRNSGLASYSADSGISPYLGLTIDYSITSNWNLFLRGEYVFQSSAVTDSPMTDRDQTNNISAGLTYTF